MATESTRAPNADTTPSARSRRRFKASELPIQPAQRSAIDDLVRTIKRDGEFDKLRKEIWAEYSQSVSM